MFEVDHALVREAARRLESARGVRRVIGGACSGTSSVCRTLARWTGVPVYDMDEQVYGRYRDEPVVVDGGITHPSVLAAAERWATFLTFDARMSATIDREAREQGIAVFARAPRTSVDELSEAVVRGLGLEPKVGLPRADAERAG